MRAVLLAAGEGRRMRPLSSSMPKPMLPVADRPLVAHVADAAIEGGADELVVVVGYRDESLRSYFGTEYRGTPVEYAVQNRREGTADALAAAREHLSADEPFAVLNGDNVYDPDDVGDLFDAGPAVASHRVDDPSNYGVLTVDDATVTGILEKPAEPRTNRANAGAYVFPGGALDDLDVPKSERGEYELTDVLATVVEGWDVTPVAFETWADVGRPWELLEANERALATQERDVRGDVAADATLRGDVVVEAGATVRSGVVVEGPALIRSGATVGPNAYVRGATLIDHGAEVGHAVEIKNSVLMPDASVSHLSYVGDSLLGPGANLGAGTQTANLRHDDDPVEFTVRGERVSTGRRKFGIVAGERAKTGINTSLNAGVTLSPGATTTPGEQVTRDR